MHPILVNIGPLTIHSYGFFVAAAFLASMAWTCREAKSRGLDHALVSDLGFYVILGAILGARILYILINPVYFFHNPLEIFMFWKGGLVFLGGAILAGLAGYRYLKKRNQPLWPWLDAMAVSVPLGQAIGRIGCLSAGCCYGGHCSLPWSITFTDPTSLAPLNVPLYPTQIYHSLAGLSTFLILLTAKRFLKTDGMLAGFFLVLYAIFRFTIEFYRGDYRGDFGFLSVTQVIAMGVFCLGIGIMAARHKKTPSKK